MIARTAATTVFALVPGVPAGVPLSVPVDVPVELDRASARAAARAELARPEYQVDRPGLVERLLGWLREEVGHLLDRAASASPGGWFGICVLVVLAVLAVVVLRRRLGPLARTTAADLALFTGRELTADDHRRAADEHAAAGRWADAVRERLRAVVRDLEARGLLEPRPGRTAHEAADEAGAALPERADELCAGARLFDDIWYGGRPATREHDADLRSLDGQVRATRPTAGSGRVATGPAAPR